MSLEGMCLCGGVRFEVTEPFLVIGYCHCEFCKHISGSIGTVSGRANTSTIHILDGEDLLRSYTPEGGSAKTFCSVCGSNLFGGGWPDTESASVRLASFGLEFDGTPQMHSFVRSVAAWETLPDDGLPRYEIRAT